MTFRSFLLFFTFPFLFSFLISCASSQQKKGDAVAMVIEKERESTEEKASTPLKERASKKAFDIENLTIGEVIRIEEPNTANLYDNSRYDFPITVNSKVEGWIDYFTGRGRPHMERYLSRSSKYIPLMKKILKENGLPEDLVYLALIESGFNLRAKSRARAVGAWQFMKATGRRYGLKVDAWIDERRDPIRSTVAAARYLKDLYLMFESWYLAASAYNAGEYKILKAIEEVKTHNFWRLSQTRTIRRETKDYIPKLIAAAILAKNPAKYGFEGVVYEEALSFDTVVIDYPVHLRELSKVLDCSEEELQDLNPELVREVVPAGVGNYELKIPTGKKARAERLLASLRGQITVGGNDSPLEHRIRNGETLASVSKKYKIRLSELANANNMSPKEKVTPGASLIIPRKVSSTTKVSTTQKRVSKKEPASVTEMKLDGSFIFHTVKDGESLWSISEKYNVTIKDIFKWNGLRKNKIMPGAKLKISPKKETESAYFHEKSAKRGS